MALRLGEPPADVSRQIKSSVDKLIRTGSLGPAERRKQLTLGIPHPIFTTALLDIESGHQLAAASRQTGWRYLVLDGDKAIAAVESIFDESGRHSFEGSVREVES